MSGWRGTLISGVALYLAAAAQLSLGRWSLFGGHVDFLLLVPSVLCLFSSRRGGMMIGFFAGWLYGSLDGANMWQYVLTRTLGGLLIAHVADTGIERSTVVAIVAAFLGVLFCQLTLMFLAPPAMIVHFLGDTIRTAVYNGVLAMLVYAGLNRILGPRP